MVKRLPLPGLLSTVTRPLCASAIPWTMARPRPLPSTLQFLEAQASERRHGSRSLPFRKRPVPFGPPLVVSALLALVVVVPFVEPLV